MLPRREESGMQWNAEAHALSVMRSGMVGCRAQREEEEGAVRGVGQRHTDWPTAHNGQRDSRQIPLEG